MRSTISDPGAFNRPLVVESDEAAGSIILQADGRAVRIGPDEARQLAWALVDAVGLVERSRGADGGMTVPADLPGPR